MFAGELAAVVQPAGYRDRLPDGLVAASEQAVTMALSLLPDAPPDWSVPSRRYRHWPANAAGSVPLAQVSCSSRGSAASRSCR